MRFRVVQLTSEPNTIYSLPNWVVANFSFLLSCVMNKGFFYHRCTWSAQHVYPICVHNHHVISFANGQKNMCTQYGIMALSQCYQASFTLARASFTTIAHGQNNMCTQYVFTITTWSEQHLHSRWPHGIQSRFSSLISLSLTSSKGFFHHHCTCVRTTCVPNMCSQSPHGQNNMCTQYGLMTFNQDSQASFHFL